MNTSRPLFLRSLLVVAALMLCLAACAPPSDMIATLTQLPLTPTRTRRAGTAANTPRVTNTRPLAANPFNTATPTPAGFKPSAAPAATVRPESTPTPEPGDLPSFDESTGQILVDGQPVFAVQRDAPGCQVHGLFFSPTRAHFLVVPSCPQGYNPGFVYTIDGSERVSVHEEEDMDFIKNGSFDWSPDGEYIVYASASTSGEKGLIIFNVQDETKTRIFDAASDPSLGLPFQPRWSPDGQWIAFLVLRPDGPAEVTLIRPDGSNQQVFDRLDSFDSQNRLEWQSLGAGSMQLNYLTPQGDALRSYPISPGP